MIEAKPCPFCGSTDISVVEGSTFKWIKAKCKDCDATCGEVRKPSIYGLTTNEPNTKAAFEEWNRRV
jgi:Lar family restriction alleviation protein